MNKELTKREVTAIMKCNGFFIVRTKGGHAIYSNGKQTVAIPIHKKMVNRMLFRRLVKENNLDI